MFCFFLFRLTNIFSPSAKLMHTFFKDINDELVASEPDFRAPHLTFLDPEVADIWSVKAGREEYMNIGVTKTYNPEIAKAISLARCLADPLTEIAKLYQNKEVLSLFLHDLQDMVNQDVLYDHLGRVFVLVVNAVGVDINDVLRHPWKQHLLSFVAGIYCYNWVY